MKRKGLRNRENEKIEKDEPPKRSGDVDHSRIEKLSISADRLHSGVSVGYKR